MTDTPHDLPSTTGGHERRDVAIRPVVASVAALGAVILVTVFSMRALLTSYDARPGAEAPQLAAEYRRTEPPAPRLQARPVVDLQALHQAEDQLLHGYAWVDRQAGTVRIPIERAMQLLAERAR
jgi:hypothetical protein